MSSTTINVRASLEVRDLIDRAATLQGKTRTDFMLQAAQSAAQQVLLDQVFFTVSPEQLDAFEAVMAQPLADADALRALLAHKAPWEQ
ncbi:MULTISPECIES: DUF1778 domain-containing protein [Derxia]|uniref:DUF1778 domain-containing protein n=1 Tax=Derxia gummosa DSM 723 TaxID=1121388 RepID=A0A8B6X1I3_9BURK|nr:MULTISPECIES: DUF1778 domain-containing protein [Derxia]